MPSSCPGVAEPHHLPVPRPLCSLHGQFGLDLLARALLGGFGWRKRLLSWVAGGGVVLGVGTGRGWGAVLQSSGRPGQAWSEHRWPRSARLQVATQAPRIFSPVKGKLRAAAELQCSRTPADGPASELRGSTCQAPWQCRWVGVYVCVCEGEPPLPG